MQIVILILNVSSGFKLDSRIINGVPTYRGQFPYYAFLLTSDDQGTQRICGGTIIDSKWILTAAHCVDRAQNVSSRTIVVGSWKIFDRNEKNRQIFKINSTQIVLHQNFSREQLRNDIALIHLSKPIQFDKYVKPVKLLSSCESTESLDTIIIGNGIQNETKGYDMPAPVLQWTVLKTMTAIKCKQYYSFISSKEKICAGNQEMRSAGCRGDSGGPLIRMKDSALIGVFSFTHVSGCTGGYPQAFINVCHYYSWISKITSIKLPDC